MRNIDRDYPERGMGDQPVERDLSRLELAVGEGRRVDIDGQDDSTSRRDRRQRKRTYATENGDMPRRVTDHLPEDNPEGKAVDVPQEHKEGKPENSDDLKRRERQQKLRRQWEKLGKAHDGLVRATETISEELVEALHEAATEPPPQMRIIRGLPSANDDTIFLPPHIFGNLDDPEWEPEIPESEEGVEEVIKSYKERKANCWINGSLKDRASWLNGDGKNMTDILNHYRENDMSLSDQDTWNKYREIALKQVNEGQYNLEPLVDRRFRSINAARNENNPVSDLMDGVARSEECMGMVDYPEYRHPRMKWTDTPADTFALPVGEYGADLTERFMKTIMKAKAKVHQVTEKESVKQIAEQEKEALETHSARARIAPKEVSIHERLGYAEEEGIVSIVQALSLFTAQKVEGYDNPDDLVKDIVDAGLIEELTRTIPMGLLGPMINMGGYMPGLVQRDEKKKLILNPSWKAALKEVREKQVDGYIEEWEKYEAGEDGYELPDGMALFCPAAKPHGAISTLKEPLAEIFFAQASDQ